LNSVEDLGRQQKLPIFLTDSLIRFNNESIVDLTRVEESSLLACLVKAIRSTVELVVGDWRPFELAPRSDHRLVKTIGFMFVSQELDRTKRIIFACVPALRCLTVVTFEHRVHITLLSDPFRKTLLCGRTQIN